MKDHFEVVIGKGKTKNVIPINEQKTNEIGARAIETEVKKYLKNLQERDSGYAEKAIRNTVIREIVPKEKLRAPEARFQNSLLRIFYQSNLNPEIVEQWIKNTLAKEKGEHSIKIQEKIQDILVGVGSCLEAIQFLEKKLNYEHKNEEVWIATDDSLDAQYKVDLLAGAENKEGGINVLYLVQVKSSINEEKIENITETHQAYLDALPKLIGMLNEKEAKKITEKEIIDIEHSEDKKDELPLFGLVLDKYLNDKKDSANINAVEFYELFKKEGGTLNPFIVKEILRELRTVDKHRDNQIISKYRDLEEYLTKTADKIPYTEEEALVYYKENHVHTIINSAKIISVVMVRGQKVSEKVLKHPYLI